MRERATRLAQRVLGHLRPFSPTLSPSLRVCGVFSCPPLSLPLSLSPLRVCGVSCCPSFLHSSLCCRLPSLLLFPPLSLLVSTTSLPLSSGQSCASMYVFIFDPAGSDPCFQPEYTPAPSRHTSNLLHRVCGVLAVCLALILWCTCSLPTPRLWSPLLAPRLWSYSAFVESPPRLPPCFAFVELLRVCGVLSPLPRSAFVEPLRVCGVPPSLPLFPPASRLWSYSAFVESSLSPLSPASRLWSYSAFVEFPSLSLPWTPRGGPQLREPRTRNAGQRGHGKKVTKQVTRCLARQDEITMFDGQIKQYHEATNSITICFMAKSQWGPAQGHTRSV